MENLASILGPVREQSIYYSSLTPDRRVPMVATEDIGRTAARILVEKQRGVVELVGPEEYSPNEAAALMSKILGREIKVVAVPEQGIVPSLTQAGLTRIWPSCSAR